MAQNPVITIEMENGDIIKAELYPEIAPNTVNNFYQPGKQRLLQRSDFPSRHRRLHDPGRMPGRNRHGWSWILH